MAMKRILVIGASGFVGGHVTRGLLARGYTVRCMARKPAKVQNLAAAGCEILPGDISDFASIQRALEGMDAVYISVQTLAPQDIVTAGQGFMEIELNGLHHIVTACQTQNVHRLVYVTSIGVAPDTKSVWTRERWRAQEFLLKSGLNVTIIQPGMIVGTGGQGFGMMVANARKRLAIVVGSGRNKFRCIAIDDLAYYLVGVLDEPQAYGQCYEVGSDDILTNDQLIDTVADVLGRLHPNKFHIPLTFLGFMVPMIQLMAKMPKGAMKGMVDSLGEDMVGNPSAIRKLLTRQPLTIRQAIVRALEATNGKPLSV